MRLKRAALAAGIAALTLGFGGQLRADTVTFETDGAFTAPVAGGDVATNFAGGDATLTTPSGLTTLSFFDVGPTGPIIGAANIVTLGTFTLETHAPPSGESFYSSLTPLEADSFTITIHQTVTPGGSGSGSSTGDVTTIGSIFMIPGGASGGAAVSLTFTPNPIMIGDKSYTLIPSFVSLPTAGGVGTGTLQATLVNPSGANAAPMPAAVWGGTGLFGLVAASRLRRRVSIM